MGSGSGFDSVFNLTHLFAETSLFNFFSCLFLRERERESARVQVGEGQRQRENRI